MTGSTKKPSDAYADPSMDVAQVQIKMWSYPSQFGIKRVIPPLRPPSLDYPTTIGRNAQGKIDGALLLPAQVIGVGDLADSIQIPICASARFTLTASAIETDVTIGIQPFKDSQ